MAWLRWHRTALLSNREPRLQEDWLTRLTRVATKESWGSTFLQLAWTAGPVTLLAMWGGFYIGFGKAPPTENMVYFFAFTVFAGIIAIITRVVSNALKSKEADEARVDLGMVINQLPFLWSAARNLSIETLPPEVRRYEAVWHILQHSHLRSTDLELCFQMMGFPEALCQKAAEIDMYRRYGMVAAVEATYAAIAPDCQPYLEAVGTHSPKLKAALEQRLQGMSSTVRTGIPRLSGFIERGFAAMELNQPELMTSWDAVQVFILTFELINGRSIPLLTFHYRGAPSLVRAIRDLRQARGAFRDALRVRNSRIKALAAVISAADANVSLIPDPHAKMRVVLEACEAYLDRIMAQKRRSRQQTDLLRQAAVLWSYIEDAQRQLTRRSRELVAEQARYRKVIATSAPTLSQGKGYGMKVQYKAIELNDEQRLEVVQAIKPIICTSETLSLPLINSMATDVLLVLNDVIAISTPEVQFAIESAPAPNFSSIDLDVSANTKAMWAKNVIDELERNDNAGSLAQLVARMVNYYGVALDSKAVQTLCQLFNLEPSAFTSLQHQQPSVDDLVAETDSLAGYKIRKNPYRGLK